MAGGASFRYISSESRDTSIITVMERKAPGFPLSRE
jgi:hypothetical protein